MGHSKAGKSNQKKSGRGPSAEEQRLKQVTLSLSHLFAVVEKTATQPLTAQEQEELRASVESLAFVLELIKNKDANIRRLRRLLFGDNNEKLMALMNTLLANAVAGSPQGDAAAGDSTTAEEAGSNAPTGNESPSVGTEVAPVATQEKKKGHGRNGAADYTGARRCKVPHETLKRGDVCPDCGAGKVYPLAVPAVLVRIEGLGPLVGTVYEQERLRCNLCGKVYTARLPEGVTACKYDESVTAMVGLLRYGCGLPFYRLSKLQMALGIPMPSSTAFELVEAGADELEGLYEALIQEAARGRVVHNDDTKARILTPPDPLPPLEGEDRSERTGLFTTGMVSEREGHRVALYFTGRQHAGENLRDVLARRATGLGPPVQMSDALSCNTPQGIETMAATCLAHARRNFIDVAENFPDEVLYILKELGRVYHADAQTRRQGLNDLERMAYHQLHSAEVLRQVKAWMEERFTLKEVEPNSGLGQAMRYMLKRWETFTLFLRIPGVPLDNNVVERALKRAILHRKNSLFFKTWNGARVGDLWMSLVHTCELNGVDPFRYLHAVLQASSKVNTDPEAWLPWRWREQVTSATVRTPTSRPA